VEKIYLTDPFLTETEAVVESALARDDELWVSPDSLLYHPEGGGQPTDRGHVIIEGLALPLAGIAREKQSTYLRLSVPAGANADELADALGYGTQMCCFLDWDFRFAAMRLHTGAHAIMAALKKNVAGFVPKGMSVSPSSAMGVLRFMGDLSEAQLAAVGEVVAGLVAEGRSVTAGTYRSLDEAAAAHAEYFRVDDELRLRGPVRMVTIEGFDFNPCGGTHLRDTRQIGCVVLGGLEVEGERRALTFHLAAEEA
jgi:alanyl-tRNA synthetase